MINGNLEGIRASLLEEMETLYTAEFDEDEFAPPALIEALAKYTGLVRREISIYLTRSGAVCDVTIGGLTSVPLSEIRMRRSRERLAGVRCIHSHPGGDPTLSDVDLNALASLKLDAMAAVGVLGGRATGISAAFLEDMENGAPKPRETGVVAISHIPQADWMRKIDECDALMQKTTVETQDDRPERAILVGIESEASLAELASLAETAGAEVVLTLLQKRDKQDNTTYIGSGKAEQLMLEARALDAELVIVDDELSGAQTRNLERLLGTRVIDRTTLILDIFAQRAQSRAGKLQVEMAQLSYKLPRLMGQGIALSRLGAGIGTRGPGESKLEISRRRVRERLSDLREEIADLSRQRATQRARREKNDVPIAALVGYTNTGKSTLLNLLSGADAQAENKLFVTLDPITRRVPLKEGGEYLLVDTVGFIRKLPHALVDAFRSTLEEVLLCDLLVIVSDASSPDVLSQREVVSEVLSTLGAGDKPTLDVLNKMDLVESPPLLPGAIEISAQSGEGIDRLTEAITKKLFSDTRTVTLLVPFSQGAILPKLYEGATVLSEQYEPEGTLVTVRIDSARLSRILATLGADALRQGREYE